MAISEQLDPGAIIRRRVSEVGKTQQELARSVGKKQAWVSSYLFGNAQETLRRLWVYDRESFERLAEALDWEVSKLLALAGVDIPGIKERVEEDESRVAIPVQAYRLRIYDAGTGPAWDLDEGDNVVLYLPELKGFDASLLFCLRAQGESMKPYLEPGDIALVYRDAGLVKPGKAVAVWFADDGVCIKRFYSEREGVLLLGNDNPNVEPRVFEAPLGSRITGVVLKVIKDG